MTILQLIQAHPDVGSLDSWWLVVAVFLIAVIAR